MQSSGICQITMGTTNHDERRRNIGGSVDITDAIEKVNNNE